MYRANIHVGEGVERDFEFDFAQTISRDEVIHKVFSIDRTLKARLSDPTGEGIWPGIVINWTNLDAKTKEYPVTPDIDAVPGNANTLEQNVAKQITETDAG